MFLFFFVFLIVLKVRIGICNQIGWCGRGGKGRTYRRNTVKAVFINITLENVSSTNTADQNKKNNERCVHDDTNRYTRNTRLLIQKYISFWLPTPTTSTVDTTTAISIDTEEDLIIEDLLNEPNLLQHTEYELQKIMLELTTHQIHEKTPATTEEVDIISALLLPMEEQEEDLGEFNAHLGS